MTIEFISNHLWQSTCFAFLAGLLTFVLRNGPSKVRYWLWLSASLKFLVPLAWLVSLGSLIPRPAPHVPLVAFPAPVFPSAILQTAEPFTPILYSAGPVRDPIHWRPVIGMIWLLGLLAVASLRGRSWFHIRAALGAGRPIELPIPIPALVAPSAVEPGIVGFLRPVLVLPDGLLERLNARQRDAVLAHEMCHVRRRDNFFAAIHMAVEAIVWFHPAVWWIGSRMLEEREGACDEEVLRMGCEPADYVGGILKVCRFHKESPLPCVSGVTGADVKKRLRAILAGSIARELNAGKKVALAAVGLAAVAAPVVIGLLNAPAIRAQNAAAASPKFEVVSIKPCDPAAATRPMGYGVEPGKLKMYCMSVDNLIGMAYLTYPEPGVGTTSVRGEAISGGPAWLKSAPYNIEAKAEGNPSGPVMGGPMLRALLEDRFQLKLHRETKEIPVYALTVASSGFRLKPLPEGSCTPFDYLTPQPQGLTPAEARAAAAQRCNWRTGYNYHIDVHAATLDQMAGQLSHLFAIDRPVVNRTGIAGMFDFHLEYAPDGTSGRTGFTGNSAEPAAPPPDGPSIFTAVQEQLGLKLEPSKGPGEFLVIDHVERPSEN